MPSVEVLRTEKLKKYFGGVRALDGVDIKIREGEFVGLIGPNGSGKTTLFNVISGVYKPDSGKVYFYGRDVTGYTPHDLYKLGLVRSFQIPRLWYNMTVVENTATASRERPGADPVSSVLRRRAWIQWESDEEKGLAAKVFSTIEKLGLTRVILNWAHSISGGQMKLTDISRSLVGEARLLLLDEPAAGVAPGLSRDIFETLKVLNREGLTIFVIEHKLEVLFDYVERVIVMHEGKVLTEGTPDEVAKDPLVLDAYLGEPVTR
ncbi:MAG: ABC transporter ATP-binding protein [Desulfurococcales archaeon]|nr:ABC transporter ATP-binding protein [Desulfurococcales archaeon]MEB3806925.1 ABC transporter ATP-binding protein [Desulfurococcales archaeon]